MNPKLSATEEVETDTVVWERLLEAPVDEAAVEADVEEEVEEATEIDDDGSEDQELEPEPEEDLLDLLDTVDEEESESGEFEHPFYGPREEPHFSPCGCF